MPNEIEEQIPQADSTRVFTIVHLNTNEIGLSGQCSASLYDRLAPDDCLIFPVVASPSTHYFNGTELVAYTAEQAAAKAVLMPGCWKWSDVSMSWEDKRVLADVQAEKWAEMKIKRQQVQLGSFEWDGSVFDCDEKSQSLISGTALAAFVASAQGLPYEKEWTLADNTVRLLSATDIISMARAMDAHITAAHETGRVLREAIYSATSKQEVEAVQWPE